MGFLHTIQELSVNLEHSFMGILYVYFRGNLMIYHFSFLVKSNTNISILIQYSK